MLTHTAGRITVPPVDLTDWQTTVAALAAADSDWPPGEVVCEHAQTFGFLVGELVRRIDGRSLGRFFAEELAGPLGLDISIGVGDADLGRVADTVGLDRKWWATLRGRARSTRHRSLGPWVDVNEAAWRQAELPAVNGHATARGLASFWQAYLDGRLPAGVGDPGATGYDRFVRARVTWTMSGGRGRRSRCRHGRRRRAVGLRAPGRRTCLGVPDQQRRRSRPRAERVEASLVATLSSR